MAVTFLARNVSELCLGKPPLRSLPLSATAADALTALRRSGERFISVWNCECGDRSRGCVCVGRICMADLVCFMCREESLANPSEALGVRVSDVMVKGDGIVRHLDPNSSVLEAIDCILEGAQHLIIPIKPNKTTNSRKKHLNNPLFSPHNNLEHCWLTQEDILRFLLNSISTFSPLPTLSLESLHLIDPNISTVHFDHPLSPPSIVPTLTPIAVVDEDNKLVGEISPHSLARCDEPIALAAAMAMLSAGDLMAFIDCSGSEDSSSTSDEELGPCVRSFCGFARKSEAIVCYPWSSLVAVMVQALAYRVSYVWVINGDYSVAGVVTFEGILSVFRSSVGRNFVKK